MTPHNKFIEFIDTVENEQTEVVIESVPADKHWISTIEINGEEAKLLQLNDNYIFIFAGEAQVLNVKQYNAVAESFKKVIEILKDNS
jgi:hypothetical protein